MGDESRPPRGARTAKRSSKLNARQLTSQRRRLELALKQLSAADAARLAVCARLFALRLKSDTDGDELLNEMIAATIGGSRVCPRRVKFLPYAIMTMRGIASRIAALELKKQGGDLPLEGDYEDGRVNQEQDAIAKDQVRRLLRWFSGDKVALGVIELMLDGFERAEIIGRLKIDSTEYDAAWKRIRRRAIQRLITARRKGAGKERNTSARAIQSTRG